MCKNGLLAEWIQKCNSVQAKIINHVNITSSFGSLQWAFYNYTRHVLDEPINGII